MIAKGNLHGDGAKLAAYLLTGEDREIAQLIETRGLEGFGGDPVAAFDAMQQVADAQTNSTKPFFHTQTRNAPGERLTDAQWLEVAEREEKRLGFTGQPRILSLHIDPATGDKHLHAAWFRIDLEHMRAIDPGMFKNNLKEVARTAERDFALREVSNTRQPHDRARIADRKEAEQSRRLGTDVRAIRTAILDCYEQSDSGKAFRAALDGQGLMLANGDRRDCFVVVDHEGGHHALNKKLTGQTLAGTRERLADLDRSQLPSVEQAQALQAERHPVTELAAEKEIHRQPEQPRTDFAAAAARTTEPITETETRAGPEPSIVTSQPASTVSREAEPAAAAADPEPEIMRAAGGIGRQILDAVTRPIANFIMALADMFAPPPPETKQQAHDRAQAEGNVETRHAQAHEATEQEKDARLQELLDQLRRQDAERDLSFSQRYGTPPTREANPRERDDDYGRERER
jgi:hypothetical protein